MSNYYLTTIHWSDLFPGIIQPPTGVTVKAVNGSDFVVISWNYQADVTLYRIFFRSFKSTRGNSSISPDEFVGPMSVYCLPDISTCSYCVSNINRRVSCNKLNSKYQAPLLRSELDFEELVSVKVEPCSDYFPDTCENQSRWKNYTIPPGGMYNLLFPSKSDQIQNWETNLNLPKPIMDELFDISCKLLSRLIASKTRTSQTRQHGRKIGQSSVIRTVPYFHDQSNVLSVFFLVERGRRVVVVFLRKVLL